MLNEDKQVEVIFDPTYTFSGFLSLLNFKLGLHDGIWPNDMVIWNCREKKGYRVSQQCVAIKGGRKGAQNVARGLRRRRAKDPEIMGPRDQFAGWTIDQLVDEILRLGKEGQYETERQAVPVPC